MEFTASIICLVSLFVLEGVSGLPEPRIASAPSHIQTIGEDTYLPIPTEELAEIQQLFYNHDTGDTDHVNWTADYESANNISTASCYAVTCTWVGGRQSGQCSSTPIEGHINTGQAECGIGCSCYVLHPRPWVPDTTTTLKPDTDKETASVIHPNSTCGGPRIGGCGDGYCVFDGQPCRFRLSNCLCEAVGTFCCDGLPSQ